MKKLLVLALLLGMCVIGSTGVASENCVVTAVSSNDDISSVLINCKPNVSLKKGDLIKVKVRKPATASIEGC